MKLPNFKLSLLGIAILMIGVISCKDDFTQEDLVKQQTALKKTISASDSLQLLMAMNEFQYKKYIDSLKRADSLALEAGLKTYLPYTYEVQVVDGSITTQDGGKTEGFANDVTVTITQYGVKQTATSKDGLFTFKNIGVGVIHGSVSANGYTTFEWQVDVTLPYQFFKEATQVSTVTGGAAGGTNGVGGPGTIQTYLSNQYYLQALLKYFNQRSLGNSFAIFATAGASANTLSGRAFIETNLTNRTKEVVPAGTQISAYIDMTNSSFVNQFIKTTSTAPSNSATATSLNNIFSPQNYAYTFLGTTATDANGDFSITLPSSPDAKVPIKFEYSDVVANKTFFIESNGDVTAITRRNVYGQGVTQSTLPTISTAPTVSFEAGGGAQATATISGNGSISDIDLTSGGKDYQGTPRVLITAPPAGGTQATATATVTGGVVTGIAIVNPGSGYTSAPTITITEGSGALASNNGFVVNATNGGVANVRVTNPGTMNFVPNVVFWYDLNANATFDSNESLDATNFPNGVNPNGGTPFTGTNFPAATAVLNGSGVGLSSINVTNTGGFISQAPEVLITSGNFAQATATVTGGVVTAVTISNAGKYYASAPTISLPVGTFGAGTTTAVLTPTVTNGTISGITITNAGAGYNNGTFAITITPKALGGAAGSVVWQGLGLSSIQVTNPGTINTLDNKYYTNVPKVVISNPDFTGTGSKVAAATAILGQDGRVIGINVTDPGFGYYPTSTPTITILSGSGAAATAEFADKAIQEIDVTVGGSGYIVAPSVLIVDPTKAGSGATATAKITNGVVTSITLTNAGSGYINGAAVIILDPGTTYQPGAATSNSANSGRAANKAEGNVIVQNGVITGIEVYRAGDNYPSGTEVRIKSTRGTGATATSTVTAGKVSAVTVTAGGTQYTGNNYYKGLGSDIDPNVGDASGSYTVGLGFSTNPSTSPYMSKSGVKKIMDIHYGTGANRD